MSFDNEGAVPEWTSDTAFNPLEWGSIPPAPAKEKSLKERWIEALRSGKYQQCFESYHYNSTYGYPESFCAVGVLFEIAGINWHEVQAPSSMAAINTVNMLMTADRFRDIVALNDSERMTFAAIADYIEKTL